MQWMFRVLPKQMRGVILCLGCFMSMKSAVHQFSSDALSLLYEQQKAPAPVVTTEVSNASAKKCSTQLITADRLYTMINTAACIYACIRIWHSYQHHFVCPTPVSDNWCDQLATIIKDIAIVKKMRFGIALMGIAGETLVGKSLAKLVVLCATGDITDVLEQAVIRIKRVIMG